MNKILYSFSVLFLLSATAFAQKDTSKTQTIDLTSSFKPVLRNAVKINFSGTQLVADTSRPILSYTIPVSYTHLDVYKRQQYVPAG